MILGLLFSYIYDKFFQGGQDWFNWPLYTHHEYISSRNIDILNGEGPFSVRGLFEYKCSYTYCMEKAMAPHSSTLAWKIPWTEEPGRLQSMG